MPRYISRLGKWKPVREYYVNPEAEPGTNPVYDGIDRGAIEQLKELNMWDDEKNEPLDTPGVEAHQNPDLVLQAHQFGFNGPNAVYDYLEKVRMFSREKAEKSADLAISQIKSHKEAVKGAQPYNELAGGRDYSGQGKHRVGGLGDPGDVSPNALKSRVK